MGIAVGEPINRVNLLYNIDGDRIGRIGRTRQWVRSILIRSGAFFCLVRFGPEPRSPGTAVPGARHTNTRPLRVIKRKFNMLQNFLWVLNGRRKHSIGAIDSLRDRLYGARFRGSGIGPNGESPAQSGGISRKIQANAAIR
jgi:hypothetical protein